MARRGEEYERTVLATRLTVCGRSRRFAASPSNRWSSPRLSVIPLFFSVPVVAVRGLGRHQACVGDQATTEATSLVIALFA